MHDHQGVSHTVRTGLGQLAREWQVAFHRALSSGDAPSHHRQFLEPLEGRVLLASTIHGPLSPDQLLRLAAGEDPWAPTIDYSIGEDEQTQSSPTSSATTSTTSANTTVGVAPTGDGGTASSPDSGTTTGPLRSAADFRYILRPGSGWTGPTDQPGPVGDPAAPGYDAKSIARWDVVPYQTFDGLFHVGVVAFHMNGIDRVDFSVNGGDWTAVRTMTRNPQTDVYEYTATVNASDFPDGPLEVRAIAWPTTGVPRVLDSLPLNSNANATLPTLIRWVSPTGSDTTGDGSEQNPFGTIMKAAKAIQIANGTGNADGGTIYLTAGDHVYGTYSFSLLTTTQNRWLTVTSAPGVPKDQVRLVASGTTDGLRTKLVQLKNLTIAPNTDAVGIITSNGPLQDYVWTHGVDVIGRGRQINANLTSGWSGQYVTDTNVSSMRDGLFGEIVRNTHVSDIGSDAFSDSGLVVNCTASNIDASGTSFHADVVQYYGRRSNVIVYGLEATLNVGAQGLFAGSNIDLTDVAFVDVNVNNAPIVMYAFQFGGPTRHMYVFNCSFSGALGGAWRPDLGFTAQNVVIERSSFSAGPGQVPGVVYRP